MKFIDLHCDTIDRLLEFENDNKLLNNNHSVDLIKLKEGN